MLFQHNFENVTQITFEQQIQITNANTNNILAQF